MSKTYYSNPRVLDGASTPPEFGLHDTATALEGMKVGTRIRDGERTFFLAKAGAALDAGKLLESAVFGGAATAAQVDLTVAAGAVGDTTITVTVANSQAKDLFAEGYVSIVSDTNAHGAGQNFKVKSHAALTATALPLEVYDGVGLAFTADCKASLQVNPFMNVKETAVTTAVGFPVGVPLVDVASGSYFWCQTWGPATVWTSSTVTKDSRMDRSLTAGQSVTRGANTVVSAIGNSIQAGSANDYPLMNLTLFP
jgi:hypothetical protein